jgi:hypothetical protein
MSEPTKLWAVKKPDGSFLLSSVSLSKPSIRRAFLFSPNSDDDDGFTIVPVTIREATEPDAVEVLRELVACLSIDPEDQTEEDGNRTLKALSAARKLIEGTK